MSSIVRKKYLKIKELIGRSSLASEIQIRNRRVRSLSEIKTIGILYDATDREIYEYMNETVKRFREDLKKVSSLGFIDSKDDRDMLGSKLGFDFFNRKQLDYLLRPYSPVVQNFYMEEFDLLIDCNIENHWPLEYIMRKSNACLKVGVSPSFYNHYDLSFRIQFPISEPPYKREEKLNILRQLFLNTKKYLHNI